MRYRYYDSFRYASGPTAPAVAVTYYTDVAGTILASLTDSAGAGIANPVDTSAKGFADVYCTTRPLYYKGPGDATTNLATCVTGVHAIDFDPNGAPFLALTRSADVGSTFEFANTAGRANGYIFHLTNHGHGTVLGIGEGNNDGTGETDGIGVIIDEWGHGKGLQQHLMSTSGAEAVGQELTSENANVGACLQRYISNAGAQAMLQEIWTNGSVSMVGSVRVFFVDWAGNLRFGTKKVSRVQLVVPATCNTSVIHAAITLPTSGTLDVTTGIAYPTDTPFMYRNLSVVGNALGITGNVVITGTDNMGRAITNTIALNGTTVVYGTVPFKTVTKINVPARTNAGDTVAIGTGYKFGLYSPVNPTADVLLQECAASGATAFTIEATGSVGIASTPEGFAYSTVARVPVAGDRLRWTYVSTFI